MTEAAAALLKNMGFNLLQKREVWKAYQRNPAGVERCARRAHDEGVRAGTTGAGLLIAMIRAGDHLVEPSTDARPITGWRWTRGSHGETWLPDPEGRDAPPHRYQHG